MNRPEMRQNGAIFWLFAIAAQISAADAFPKTAYCDVHVLGYVDVFGPAEMNILSELNECYTVVAADRDACTSDAWTWPSGFVVLAKNDKKEKRFKLKMITHAELIEAEIDTDAPFAPIRLRVNAAPAAGGNATARGDLYAARFDANDSALELERDGDLRWLRFERAALRLLQPANAQRVACGRCATRADDEAAKNVRARLAAAGHLRDESEDCRIRVYAPPKRKCELSATRGVRFLDVPELKSPDAERWTAAQPLDAVAAVNTGCYAPAIVDYWTCQWGFDNFRYGGYIILARRAPGHALKIKVVTKWERIELERERNGSEAPGRRLRVTLNGQPLPYQTAAHDGTEGRCTVEFMSDDFSHVEVHNALFWLRFDGSQLVLRPMEVGYRSGWPLKCGLCRNPQKCSVDPTDPASNNGSLRTPLRVALAAAGYLDDEPAVCRHPHLRNPTLPTATDRSSEWTANAIQSSRSASVSAYRTPPTRAFIIKVRVASVCASTRAVAHCVPPSHDIFSGTNVTERVSFICMPRAGTCAQEFLNLAFRRRALLSQTANASVDETSELRALERDIERLARDCARLGEAATSDTLAHRVPDFCTCVPAEPDAE